MPLCLELEFGVGMIWKSAIVTMATTAFSFSASAFTADKVRTSPSAEYEKCIKAAGAVDPAMAACAVAELERRDKALNAVYRELSGLLEPEERADLVKSERAWIAYRDAECAYQSSSERGGTLERVIHANCQMSQTVARENELKADLALAKKFRR